MTQDSTGSGAGGGRGIQSQQQKQQLFARGAVVGLVNLPLHQSLNVRNNGHQQHREFHSRRRRSIGSSVSQVVDRHITTMNTGGAGQSGLGLSGGYTPSFAASSKPKAMTTSSSAQSLLVLQDSASHSATMRRGSGISLRNLDDLGGLKRPTPDVKNSLVQIGTAPPPMIMPPRSTGSKGVGSRHQPSNRKLSLGLSYGPIVSSLDDQAAMRKRNMTTGNNVSSRRQPPPAIRNQSDLLVTNNSSLENSWKQQVDAASARVVARGAEDGRRKSSVHPADTMLFEDELEQERTSAVGAVPNTLTLDNWFAASGRHLHDPESEQQEQEEQQPSSNASSRRSSSALAPLPDTDGIGDNDFQLHDVVHADEDDAEHFWSGRNKTAPRPGRIGGGRGKPMTQEGGTSLKTAVFGAANHGFPPGWLGQSFHFNDVAGMRYGLVQERGGPCGVMAAVQAGIIKILNFGGGGLRAAARPHNPTEDERQAALCVAIVQILSRCAAGRRNKIVFAMPTSRAHYTGLGRYRNDGVTETVSLHELADSAVAVDFIKENVGFLTGRGTHAVIAFLYSALLTRGLANVSRDMDTAELPLMGAHGYCSQELVNLLLTGKAVSNTFDYTVTLEGGDGDESSTVLKGVEERSEVGLLSLFEHYQSTTVGDHLKTPLFPIWLVCSESHFSVLWSDRQGREKTSSADRGPVDLCYYDGLAKQDHTVRLTVDCSGLNDPPHPRDEDLVPPLEHCIRTKWREASVDWNGSEKIL